MADDGPAPPRDLGVSLAVLQEQAARSLAGGSALTGYELKERLWAQDVLPDGHTVAFDSGSSDRGRTYTRPDGASATISWPPEDEASLAAVPQPTCAWAEWRARADPSAAGPVTHYVSVPFAMPFSSAVTAISRSIPHGARASACFFLPVLSRDIHTPRGDVRADLRRKQALIASTGEMVQVVDAWDDPSPFRRLWLLVESTCALHAEARLTIALTPHERRRLAETLAASGPSVVLRVVAALEVEPAAAATADSEAEALRSWVQALIEELGGVDEVRPRLLDVLRQAYARAAEAELAAELRGHAHLDEASAAAAGAGAGAGADGDNWALELIEQTAPAQWSRLAHRLCLRVAELWELGSAEHASRRAERLLRAGLRALDRDDAARAPRAAALGRLLRRQGRVREAHAAESEVSRTGALAVSWEGVSVAFLERWAAAHESEIAWLSTDAVVQRLILPATREQKLLEPNPVGRAFIELVADAHKGAPRIFCSHAWRQTFYVPESAIARTGRGGLVQAILGAVPEPERERTMVWLDVFCVNQHLHASGGGLMAFQFDPLRQAVFESRELWLFLERYDDPAPLSRVWCLDELRTALLLNRPVRALMPPSAAATLKAQAAADERTMRAEIARIAGAVDIENAAAFCWTDRAEVLRRVRETVGPAGLNLFCEEMVQHALLSAAELARDAGKGTAPAADAEEGAAEWASSSAPRLVRWQDALDGMLRAASGSDDPAQQIEIRRAVALMRLRLWGHSDRQGVEQLAHVLEQARCYYGDKAQLTCDLRETLGPLMQR